VSFDRACALLESALASGARGALLECVGARHGGPSALRGLCTALDSNFRAAGADHRALDECIRHHDARTRDEGFHVLHDWDGKADRFNSQMIPVDVAEFTLRHGVDGGLAPALLLDYYYLHVLALLSLRAWDSGDPDRNFDRLDGLLAQLQGPDGSGHRFADRAATLLLIATAHYEPEERGYASLLEKVRTLGPLQRVAIALDHAAAIGAHLRFGFEATYGRDTASMRGDNAADYPWLAFTLSTLMDAYTPGDDAIAEALVNGLCPDPRAFVSTFRGRFATHRGELLDAFERFRPGERGYSPLGFFFNFSHNVVKGTVIDALMRKRPWRVSLNDLFTSRPRDPDERVELATTLMAYARSSPDTIRGRLMPVIVYDPPTGRRAFGYAMRVLKEDT
jgi:hypothetical protein